MKNIIEHLKAGIKKTREGFVKNIEALISGKRELDQGLLEELEEALLAADLGPRFSGKLLERLKSEGKENSPIHSAEQFKSILREMMVNILKSVEEPLRIEKVKLFTIMMVGVNGTGKTTTIAKLAHLFKKEGRETLLVAADTFRAAAIEQLELWSRKVNVPLIRQTIGADPAAVVFDALKASLASRKDVLIVDTAGRLHTKVNLMEELKKIKRIMARELPGAPHEIMLTIDATTGQNALQQARTFKEEIGVTGIVLTKLDGTAKGGIIVRIAEELKIPIRYIGVGESIDDLRVFKAEEFVEALFD